MREPSLTFRAETARDRAAVRAVHRAAFGGDAEADLVAGHWDDGVALCGFVAHEEGAVVGHILFSRLPIDTARGVIPAAALAPPAVLPARQRAGIGAALVRRGLAACRERGLASAVVLGDPDYYGRFGFRAETTRLLEPPWPGPYLMAIEFVPGVLEDQPGIARFAPAFARLTGFRLLAAPSPHPAAG